MMQSHWIRWFWAGFLVCCSLVLAGCGHGQARSDEANGKDCMRVGVLLPDGLSSPRAPSRWDAKDHPLLLQAIKAELPKVQIDYYDARHDQRLQYRQATEALEKGACVLVIGATNPVAATDIVTLARSHHVPVIAYDRLIPSKDLAYYVSFDNYKVGQLQGRYIANHYQKYQKNGTANMVIIGGSQTDTNSLAFGVGLHQVLDPLFADREITNVGEIFTPNWGGSIAQIEMQTILSDYQNNIQVAYVANDTMANKVIEALRAVNLNRKVLVTGQDATVEGIHNILLGEQNMTVYKPIDRLAQSAARLVKALHDGVKPKISAGSMTPVVGGGIVPSILNEPISVDINNLGSTVVADRFISKEDVCSGVPPGTARIC